MSLTVFSSTKDCIAENLILCHNKRSQANFFITYIMTTGWAGLPLEILQTGALIFNFLKRHTVEKSSPLLADVYSLPYYRTLPMVLLFTLFGLVYSIINPLLLPFLLVYFILGYIVFRNQVCTSFQIKVDVPYLVGFVVVCYLILLTGFTRLKYGRLQMYLKKPGLITGSLGINHESLRIIEVHWRWAIRRPHRPSQLCWPLSLEYGWQILSTSSNLY